MMATFKLNLKMYIAASISIILAAVTFVQSLKLASNNYRHLTHRCHKINSHLTHRCNKIHGLSMSDTVTDANTVSYSKNYVSFLVDIWQHVAFPPYVNAHPGGAAVTDGLVKEMVFPLAAYGLSRSTIRPFVDHFQTCKDCAADDAFLLATQDPQSRQDVLVLTNNKFKMLAEDYSDEEDEWGGFDLSVYGDETEPGSENTVFPIETNDDVILEDTRKWVRKMIADFAICPFTVDENRSGIPVGGVRYQISRTHAPEEAFLRFWEEVKHVLERPEKEVATVLLVFPELELFGNYELFETYCECLNDALNGMGIEDSIQLVTFHPKYQFRDGMARSSENDDTGKGVDAAAANYARRSPWPVLNIIRTTQVRAAQRGIPTGQVYQQNNERLWSVGSKRLQEMLVTRNWDALPSTASFAKKTQQQQQMILQQGQGQGPIDGVVSTSASESEKIGEPQVCPMHQNEAVNVIGKCPVTSGTTADSQPQSQSLSNSQSEAAKELTEIDYLALADEVEEWLKGI